MKIVPATSVRGPEFVCLDCGYAWLTEEEALAHEVCIVPSLQPLPIGLRFSLLGWRGIFRRT